MTNTPRGIRNKNPGNIDRHPGVRWQGMADDQSSDPRFVVFQSPKWGIRAIARVLITYQDKRQARDGSKIDTIGEIIDRWAPPHENHTRAYAEHVARLTRIGVDETLDVYDYGTMKALVMAIITHENGQQPYDDATIDAGLKLAGIEPPCKPLRKRPDVIATATAGLATAVTATTDALQAHLPHAVQTAATVEPVAPEWVKPLLLFLIAGLLLIPLAKQLSDHWSEQ